MNVTVELNDEQLSALIKEGIQNLDAETKQELVVSAIKKYLNEPGVMNKLIFSQTGYGCDVLYDFVYAGKYRQYMTRRRSCLNQRNRIRS